MPDVFETFPVVLVERGGTVAEIFLFIELNHTIVLKKLKVVYIFRGMLDSSSIEKASARKSQFGKIFSLKKVIISDGVFRTTSRGWYSFSHLNLSFHFSIWALMAFR